MNAPASTPDPISAAADFGVGARITLAVMSDDYQDVILQALQQTDAAGLQIDTDPVSTFVRGPEDRILGYLTDLVATAARSGRHVAAQILLSRGCPGEVCRVVTDLPVPATPAPAATGVQVLGQWALYPLADTGPDGAPTDHMREILAVIENARRKGTFVRGDHFVTTLAGDLADVLHTVADGWLAVGRTVQHVTTHLALSINSPSSAARGEA